MPFTQTMDRSASSPTSTSTSTSTSSALFPPPRNGRVVALAATVGIVGIVMFALVACLVLRLRQAATSPSREYGQLSHPKRQLMLNPNAALRVSSSSFAAPSEVPKFGFKLRPQLRVARQRDDGAWDFSDPDPTDQFGAAGGLDQEKNLSPTYLSPSLSPSVETSLHKEWNIIRGDLTPITPTSPNLDDLEFPPPAYRRYSRNTIVPQ